MEDLKKKAHDLLYKKTEAYYTACHDGSERFEDRFKLKERAEAYGYCIQDLGILTHPEVQRIYREVADEKF